MRMSRCLSMLMKRMRMRMKRRRTRRLDEMIAFSGKKFVDSTQISLFLSLLLFDKSFGIRAGIIFSQRFKNVSPY